MITLDEYLEIQSKPSPLSKKDLDSLLEYNQNLVASYPFLKPRDLFGEVIDDKLLDGRTFTELDSLPDGWRKVFGEAICEDIKQCLIDNNCLNDYRILEIKEKYGTLRWYDNLLITEPIVRKYEKLSSKICISCGKEAKWVTKGWISFLCDDCANSYVNNYNSYKSIDGDYKKEELLTEIKNGEE